MSDDCEILPDIGFGDCCDIGYVRRIKSIQIKPKHLKHLQKQSGDSGIITLNESDLKKVKITYE